jgi:hypothetical protein
MSGGVVNQNNGCHQEEEEWNERNEIHFTSAQQDAQTAAHTHTKENNNNNNTTQKKTRITTHTQKRCEFFRKSVFQAGHPRN